MENSKENGYILPATVLLGLATAILSVVLLQFTVSASERLNGTLYRALAKEAATAGVRYAAGCIAASSTPSWTTLTPKTICTGAASTGQDYLINTTDYRTTFRVNAPVLSSGKYTITSVGTVQLLSGSTVVRSYQQTTKLMTSPATVIIHTTDGSHTAGNAISIGATAACGTVDGQLYCWGSNSDGLLGLGVTDPSSLGGPYADGINAYAPYQVPALANQTVTSVSVDYRHACAVTSSGKLYCWGNNDQGQLGLGNYTAFNSPQLVTAFNGKTVTSVSAGYQHTCAIVNSQAYCWGDNTYGQLGIGGAFGGNKPTPQLISGLSNVTTIATGMKSSDAIASGSAYAWGNNSEHQLGLSGTTSYSSPQKIPSVNSVTAGDVGPNAACGISSNAVWCLGSAQYGQTGTGSGSAYTDPAAFLWYMGVHYTSTSSSSDFMHNACAISSNPLGALYCWGENVFPGGGTPGIAQQITGGDINGAVVTAVASGGRDAYTIGGNGDYATCAVADGNIICWGSSFIGLTGSGSQAYPDTVNTPTAIPNFVQAGSGGTYIF